MQITWVTYLIVCPLVFLEGFVDSVAGGGGLISIPAYLIAGLPVHFAMGTNKVSSAMGTVVATWRYSRSGYIDWKQGLCCAVFALSVFLINGKIIAPLGLAAGVFSICGNYIGTLAFARGGAKIAKPLMVAVIAIFFVKVLSELLG